MKKQQRFWIGLALALILALFSAHAPAFAGPIADKDSPSAANSVIIVNDTGDQPDANTANPTCETAPGNGKCTLRAAIDQANASTVLDVIGFSFGSAGPYKITTTGYKVTRPVYISGASYASASGMPGITVAGSFDSSGFDFEPGAAGSWVNGLIISGFGNGVLVRADHITIGSNLNGSNDLKERCIIIGAIHGITLGDQSTVSYTHIYNNWIGTLDGNKSANNARGIEVSRSFATLIRQNVISGNQLEGVDIRSEALGTVLENNLIGTNAAGTAALPNDIGVRINGVSTRVGAYDAGTFANPPSNVISGNTSANVSVDSPYAKNTVVRANWLGPVDKTTNYLPSKVDLQVDRAVDTLIEGNVMGGTDPVAKGAAILVDKWAANVTIQRNFIGLMPDGVHTAPNKFGVYIDGFSTGVVVGNKQGQSGAGNTISGNSVSDWLAAGSGVYAGTTINDLKVMGNRIGLKANSDEAAPNKWGIFLGGEAAQIGSNMDGSNDASEGNVIAYNSYGAVAVWDRDKNSIVRNSIYANGTMGIDLNDQGPTPNDSGDGDSWGNRKQNYPAMNTATLNGNQLTLAVKVDSAIANATYPLHIDVYKADALGQGKKWLGRVDYVTADAQKIVNKVVVVAAGSVAVGDKVVTTATDSEGNTSEFSQQTGVKVPAPTATPTKLPTKTPTPVGKTGSK